MKAIQGEQKRGFISAPPGLTLPETVSVVQVWIPGAGQMELVFSLTSTTWLNHYQLSTESLLG